MKYYITKDKYSRLHFHATNFEPVFDGSYWYSPNMMYLGVDHDNKYKISSCNEVDFAIK